jgi:hypothetical protein
MDDWRIEVDLPEEEHRSSFLEHLTPHHVEADQLEGAFSHAFHERVIVTRDGSTVFIYPHNLEQARRAEQTIKALAAQRGWDADVAVTRWHEAEDAWEPAEAPMPQSPAEERAEHDQLIARERTQTVQTGHFAFDVVVTCPHHGQARDLAERLGDTGLPIARRWRYLTIGAADEDVARELEQRVKQEAPEGTTVTVFTAENLRETEDYVAALGADNPFAIPGLPGLAH